MAALQDLAGHFIYGADQMQWISLYECMGLVWEYEARDHYFFLSTLLDVQ